MPTRSGRGELERAVMEHLWADSAAWWTVRDVHAALAADRDIAYTTVLTVLRRLANKGLVATEESGRAHHYRAMGAREEITAELMRDALASVDPDERRAALVRFVGQATPADVAALREALDDLPNEPA